MDGVPGVTQDPIAAGGRSSTSSPCLIQAPTSTTRTWASSSTAACTASWWSTTRPSRGLRPGVDRRPRRLARRHRPHPRPGLAALVDARSAPQAACPAWAGWTWGAWRWVGCGHRSWAAPATSPTRTSWSTAGSRRPDDIPGEARTAGADPVGQRRNRHRFPSGLGRPPHDGHPQRRLPVVQPRATDALMIGMGERYDVTVTLGDGIFPLVASAEGKHAQGFALVRTGGGRARLDRPSCGAERTGAARNLPGRRELVRLARRDSTPSTPYACRGP